VITRTRSLAAALLALTASQAQAIPVFARKYGLSCSACHEAWPILNQVGQNFRDNGYQFGLDKDDPVEISPDYVPIALRTTPAYQYTQTTNQAAKDAAGNIVPVTTEVGGVPVPPGVDLLTAGVISPGVSWLLVLSGFSPSDGAVAAESAWVQLNRLGGTTFANLRIGKFEQDLPVSPHRGIALTFGYPIYGAHPPGSAVPLDFNENTVGVSLDGHDARSQFRYSLSVTTINGAEGTSKNGWSAPLAYAHVQKTFELSNRALPRVRVGVLGALGSMPTVFQSDANGAPIPGTGTHAKQLSRAGAEAAVWVGPEQKPLILNAVAMVGNENAGLSSGTDPVSGEDLSTRSNDFKGGFLEADWIPVVSDQYAATPWAIFGRYDVVRYRNAVGDVDGYTLGVRRYLVLGPRASAAIHVEAHYDKAKRTSAVTAPNSTVPLDVETRAVLAGIDFDF
jgi:hypothetical protein